MIRLARPRQLRASSPRGEGSPGHDSKRPTLLDQWVDACLEAARTPATFYSGCRKIHRPMRLTFTSLDDSLQPRDAGYTKSKMTMLTKNYLHEPSRVVAKRLWDKRRGQKKYGSVGFSCYGHFEKGDVKGLTPRGSVFGPCIQSIVITWIDKTHYSVDAFYRTVELQKKWPADLVLIRDILLAPFDFTGMELKDITFHFSSTTSHPMYFVTIIPHLSDPIKEMEKIKVADPFFWKWLIRWTSRYILDEHGHGIAKFSQALRVKKDAHERLVPKTLKELQKYCRKSHPGYGRTFRLVRKGDVSDTDEDTD